MQPLIERFATLFEGRLDAYGTEEGGCQRVEPPSWLSFVSLCDEHLTGRRPIGVYPMVPAGAEGDETKIGDFGHVVKWGCVDFDVVSPLKPAGDFETGDEAHVAARNLCSALEAFDIYGWIERTRSGGRHVWAFSSEWVPAHTMRRALLVASQVAGTPTREVNPKQEDLPAGSVGNYVRLPYPGAVPPASSEPVVATRWVYDPSDDHTSYLPVLTFVSDAIFHRSDPSAFDAAAKLWVPPAPVTFHARPPLGTFSMAPKDVSDILPKLGGLTFTVFRDGPFVEGGDRSATLMKLAHLCREDGLHPMEARAVLEAADLDWGKFWKRRDGAVQLARMVERAYATWEGDEA